MKAGSGVDSTRDRDASVDAAASRVQDQTATPRVRAVDRMRILFAVRGLNLGGAERQLLTLARGLHCHGHHVSVAVFYRGGIFEEDLRSCGVRVHDLGKRGRWDLVGPAARLARLVHAERPEILHAYMGLANLCSAAVKPLLPKVKVVWGVRTSMDDLRAYDWLGRMGPSLDRLASPAADAIVANSHAARRRAMAIGIDGDKIVVIPNGIDCEQFRPAPESRERQRQQWGITQAAVVVGMVARLDPVKDHPTFLRAAARVAAGRGDIHFVCIGSGDPRYRRRLEQLASDLGFAARLTWSGETKVTSSVYSALDVAVLSSARGEGFPNVVGEAMACGTPCVVSDSGDAALVVGDTGAVVPPGDPDALAHAVGDVLERARATDNRLQARARARIEREYSVPLLVSRTELALRRVRDEA